MWLGCGRGRATPTSYHTGYRRTIQHRAKPPCVPPGHATLGATTPRGTVPCRATTRSTMLCQIRPVPRRAIHVLPHRTALWQTAPGATTLQCHAKPRHVLQCRMAPCHAKHRHASSTALCRGLWVPLYRTALCRVEPRHVPPCRAVPRTTTQRHTAQRHAALHGTAPPRQAATASHRCAALYHVVPRRALPRPATPPHLIMRVL